MIGFENHMTTRGLDITYKIANKKILHIKLINIKLGELLCLKMIMNLYSFV